MKNLMLLSLALVMSTGSLLKGVAESAMKENLMIKNTTKKPLSYEFVTKLKAKSPTTKMTGVIAPGASLAFQPTKNVATINFYTDGGKTVVVKTTNLDNIKDFRYLVVKTIKDKKIEFTKVNDKKDPSTALDSITIE